MTKLPFNDKQNKTQWMKLSKVKDFFLVAKDYMVVRGGNHMLIINLNTKQEYTIRIANQEMGDGVSCATGHRTIPIIAYAEFSKNPRIFVTSCPEFKKIRTMQGVAEEYIALTFSETEFLILLRGYPSCSLEVWKWRTGEFLTVTDTNLTFRKQQLRSNFGSPVIVSQLVKNTNHCVCYEILLCGKKCIITKKPVEYRDSTNLNNFALSCWTTDGSLYVVDVIGNVYLTNPNDYKLELVYSWETKGKAPVSICLFQNGFLVHGSNGEIRYLNKSVSPWKVEWSIKSKTAFKKLNSVYNKDIVLGANVNEELFLFDIETKTFNSFREHENNIKMFYFIYPKCEYFVTLSFKSEMVMWKVDTGDFVNLYYSKGILTFCSNFTYPYIAVGYDNGLLELNSCIDENFELMCSFQLSRIEIQKILIEENGTIIVTANMDYGEFFIIKGTPGRKFEIITSVRANHQIADYALVSGKSCYRLWTIFVTNPKLIAGNSIHRFCIIKHGETSVKKFEFENPKRYYAQLYSIIDHPNRDRMIYALAIDCKNLHVLEMKRGDTHARIIKRIKSFHNMKLIRWKIDRYHWISYSYGGLIIIRASSFNNFQMVICPHNRNLSGVLSAFITISGEYVISKGHEGLLVCTKILRPDRTDIPTLKKNLNAEYLQHKKLFSNPTIGFNPVGIYEGKSWLEYKELIKIEAERIKYEKRRKMLLEQITEIRNSVTELLTQNLNGPENERLDLQEFNLNISLKEEKIKASKELCEKTRLYLEKLILEQDRIANHLKVMFWDSIKDPLRHIWALYGNFDVESYCGLFPDGEKQEKLKQIQEYRSIEEMLSKNDTFRPWDCSEEMAPIKKESVAMSDRHPRFEELEEMDFEELTDEELKLLQEKRAAELENYTALSGTTTHLFITPTKGHYGQFELQTFYQRNLEMELLMRDQIKLHEYFNKEFENVMQSKIREMTLIADRNTRLRYILSELNYFSVQKYDVDINDPEWKQDENPELIIKVDNSEVAVSPYISPSEQALLDASAAEAERIRLALLADDFKERALMAMMNGVLEIRWEDELKKEVPLPKCMLEKPPEEFNEEDLKQVRDYEEKCVFLKSERERYKNILETDYSKVANQLREGVKKFNERLRDLVLLKMQVESACLQEMFKINRMRLMEIAKNKWDALEEHTVLLTKETENKCEELHNILVVLPEFITEVKTNIDHIQAKEKLLDKAFKKEFFDATTTQLEILTKLYKKRPRVNVKTITSTCVLIETGRCLVNNEKSLLLNTEALEYMKSVEVMDKYIGVPAIIDENTYAQLCKQRRIRIENELKLRAYQMDLAEAETTFSTFQKAEQQAKDETTAILNKLIEVRYNKLRDCINLELQLVLKEGLVEVPRTGFVNDFNDAVLVTRQTVEHINHVIQDAGKQKIKAMTSAMAFKREIMMMEWEHRKKKMQIADLKTKISNISSVKVTKEIQSFLKSKARGEIADKTQAFEHEVETIKNRYNISIREKRMKIMELDKRLEALLKDNKKVDEDIKALNIDICECQLNFDPELSEQETRILQMRKASYLKRSKLVQLIQTNHNEILQLQTELELLRLRTFPILEYKVDV